jgi:Protein of unknown function (DUF3105)
VSKESRRAARLARESRRQAGTGGGTGGPGVPTGSGAAGAGTSGAAAGAAGAGEAATTRPTGTTARSARGTQSRAGRREKVRYAPKQSFFERYRTAIVTIAAVAIAAIGIGWVFLGSTAAAYTCTNIFSPEPTPTVEPGSSTRLGFVQEDMGNSHSVSRPQNYLYCPPASGNHLNVAGQGPIQPRVYGPDDKVGPPNWVHNLEHGGLVVLYKGDSPGATKDGQTAFKQFFDTFPASPLCGIPAGQVSPVIARFDDMPHPYAILVWGRVMYMDTWDPALALRFFNEEAERLDANGDLVAPPEDVSNCAARLKASASPSAAASDAGASASPAASPAASAEPSPAASPEPSASPS